MTEEEHEELERLQFEELRYEKKRRENKAFDNKIIGITIAITISIFAIIIAGITIYINAIF